MISVKVLLKEIITVLNLYNQVGAIYITTAETNPGAIFGGSWSKIAGRFLIGSGSFNDVTYSVNGTGGTQNTTLGYHRHNIGLRYSNGSGKSSAYTMSGSRKRGYRYTGYAGSSGNATNTNIPPYYAVHIWRRTK